MRGGRGWSDLDLGVFDLGVCGAARFFHLSFDRSARLFELRPHRALHLVRLRLCRVTGVVESLLRRSADVFEFLLEALPQLEDLRIGLTSNFGGSDFRRRRGGAMALFSRNAHEVLRETAE